MGKEDFTALTVDKLKDKLRDLKLAVSGNKAELVERLEKHFADQADDRGDAKANEQAGGGKAATESPAADGEKKDAEVAKEDKAAPDAPVASAKASEPTPTLAEPPAAGEPAVDDADAADWAEGDAVPSDAGGDRPASPSPSRKAEPEEGTRQQQEEQAVPQPASPPAAVETAPPLAAPTAVPLVALPAPSSNSSAPVKLFVGGLPPEAGDSDLHNHFSQYGELKEAKVMKDQTTGRSRNFGFVTISTASSEKRDAALRDIHKICGRSVTIRLHQDQPEQTSSAPAPSNDDANKVFIGRLEPDMTVEMLTEKFTEKFGRVAGVFIAKGKSFGFITFETARAAKSALDAAKVEVDGTTVVIKSADPQGQRSSGGGGRGRSRSRSPPRYGSPYGPPGAYPGYPPPGPYGAYPGYSPYGFPPPAYGAPPPAYGYAPPPGYSPYGYPPPAGYPPPGYPAYPPGYPYGAPPQGAVAYPPAPHYPAIAPSSAPGHPGYQ